MTWRTVILTKDSKISLRMNHLVVQGDEVVTIPLNEIGSVVIENPNIVMTGHVLNALSEYKITTILCDDKHLPYTHMNRIYGHFRQAREILKQTNWKPERKDIAWQAIIRRKIFNQMAVVEEHNPEAESIHFETIIEDVRLNDETNREGYAAKIYFGELFGRDFIRGREAPINWALNYGYSLLSSLFTRVIVTKGLLTELGIHHHSQYNSFNLASDFMEVYRPVVDSIVKEYVYDSFSIESKRKLINLFNKKVRIKDKKQYLANSIEIYVDGLIKYLNDGNINDINFPTILFKSEDEDGV